MSDDLRDVLVPTPAEVAAVRGGPHPDVVELRAALVPMDAEVDRLRMRRGVGRRQRWWPVVAAAAVVVVGVSAVWSVEPTVETPTAGGAAPVWLSSRASVTGTAEYTVVSSDSGHTRVRLDEGVLAFDVASGGDFVVEAGEVLVTVVGTRFEVARAAERVEVGVTEGVVAVAWPGGDAVVAAGERWSGPPVETVVEGVGLVERVEPEGGTDVGAETDFGAETDVGAVLSETDVKAVKAAPRRDGPREAARAWAAILDVVETADDPAVVKPLVRDFLERFPDSPLAAEARRLEGELE